MINVSIAVCPCGPLLEKFHLWYTCGQWYGMDFTCVMLLRFMIAPNLSLVKTTLLAETMTSGMPWVSSIPLSFSVVLEDMAKITMVTSSHLEWTSVMTSTQVASFLQLDQHNQYVHDPMQNLKNVVLCSLKLWYRNHY